MLISMLGREVGRGSRKENSRKGGRESARVNYRATTWAWVSTKDPGPPPNHFAFHPHLKKSVPVGTSKVSRGSCAVPDSTSGAAVIATPLNVHVVRLEVGLASCGRNLRPICTEGRQAGEDVS